MTTDGSAGDSESTTIILDWIGLVDSAPAKVSRPEELEEWALISTTYEIHNLRDWGRNVRGLTKDGKVTIKEVSPSFHIEPKTEHVKLKK